MKRLSTFLASIGLLAGTALTSPVTVNYEVLDTTARVLNLNLTKSATTYNVTANDTIFSIAKAFDVGVCDLARINVMADPLFLLYAGESIAIPANKFLPDDYSCLLPNNTAATATCVPGGPHVYEIQPGDTLQWVANARFNITVDSLVETTAQTNVITNTTDPWAELESGQQIKIPNCDNTACTLSTFWLSYGTLQDFAAYYNVTVGQIMALNNGYNHTSDEVPLEVLTNCQYLD